MICPVCKKKWHGVESGFADHVDKCGSETKLHSHNICPHCGGDLTRAHKAEERSTVVECASDQCEFQLELFKGGKV